MEDRLVDGSGVLEEVELTILVVVGEIDDVADDVVVVKLALVVVLVLVVELSTEELEIVVWGSVVVLAPGIVVVDC